MDYINFSIAVPVFTYIKLEQYAKKKQVTKNEFVLNAILSQLASEGVGFNPLKNAGISNSYNEIIRINQP